MTYGPCAKARVFCDLVLLDGTVVTGENWCANPQQKCPRLPGEDYEKCATVCKQEGHAEVVAVRLAADKAKGAAAVLRGHTYACQKCQETLFGAGVATLSVKGHNARLSG
jgi:hypothetical protein